jgi:hypothetical protein
LLFQATAVIPGSHLWGTDRAPKVDEVTYAEMEPGSALFTLGCEYDPVRNEREALLNVSFYSNIPRCWREQMRKGRSRRSADSIRSLWVGSHMTRVQRLDELPADLRHIVRGTTTVKTRMRSSRLPLRLLANYPKTYLDWQDTTNLLEALDMSKIIRILSSSCRARRPVLENMVSLLRWQSDSR